MTAQALLFFAAGFETTSSTIVFCLYEISVNPEIQRKMQKEIDEVLAKHNGKPNYQTLKDMNYMEAVINGMKLLIAYIFSNVEQPRCLKFLCSIFTLHIFLRLHRVVYSSPCMHVFTCKFRG